MTKNKNYKDMSTEELKDLLSTLEFLASINDGAKEAADAIKKEISRRAK